MGTKKLVLALVPFIGLALLATACSSSNDEETHIDEPTATVEEIEATEEPAHEATATPKPTEEPAPEPTAAPEPAEAPEVSIAVGEWSITTDISSVPAGETLYVATNSGALPHEVVFLRTDRPVDDLPLDDNSKVNRFAEGIEDLGVIRSDALVPGATASEPFDLPAGNYALICNIPGHYSAGMFVGFSIQ